MTPRWQLNLRLLFSLLLFIDNTVVKFTSEVGKRKQFIWHLLDTIDEGGTQGYRH